MMNLALTILKALVIAVGMIFIIKGFLSSKTENKLWNAVKIIGLIFTALLLITLSEFLWLKAF